MRGAMLHPDRALLVLWAFAVAAAALLTTPRRR
jgi:hypothetical protein